MSKLRESNKLFSMLSSPAQRALRNNNILNLHQLARYTEKEVLSFHGMGKSSIPKLRKLLQENALNFKQ